MRQKIISLSLDTYELASKKANFSAWVRRKLLEEVPKENLWYDYYCSICEYYSKYQTSRVLGIKKFEDCNICGNTAMLNGESLE